MFYQRLLLSLLLVLCFSLNARAQKSVESLADVSEGHWAFQAIKELVEKYGVMEGFPDGEFKGGRNITRYEAAAAFYKIMLQVANVEELTKRIGKLALKDLQTMKTLQEEFQQELSSLKAQNTEQADKIKKLEEELAKVKADLGSVRFGGRIGIQGEDQFEDNFRPAYGSNFRLSMRIAATDKTTIRANLSGNFSSIQQKAEKGEEYKKSQFAEKKDVKVSFGEAWFDHKVGGFLAPNVKFGYMGVWSLVDPSTRVSHLFGDSILSLIGDSSVSLADPNISDARVVKSFVVGGQISEGAFGLAAAASPDVFFGQFRLDLGLVRLLLVSEGDQALVIGEPVLDPLHNHTAIIDIGNDIFGLSLQAKFRGLADEFDFRGASALANLSLGGFTLGGSGKFQNEKTYQQVIAGAYLGTPGNLKELNEAWPDVSIPRLVLAAQSPFSMINGELFEGSSDEVGDLAGFMLQLSYDNPIIPNLTLELSQKRKVLFDERPEDVKFLSTTFAVSSSYVF